MANNTFWVVLGTAGAISFLLRIAKNKGYSDEFTTIGTPQSNIDVSYSPQFFDIPTTGNTGNKKNADYPGVNSPIKSNSTYAGYAANKINPRQIPDDVATNPAFLMSKVLPGGSGGVIQGLLLAKAAPIQSPLRLTVSQKINKVLPGW